MNHLVLNQMSIIGDLFIEKNKQLIHDVGNLKIEDVKADASFEKTTHRIKNKILLTEVVFAEPAIKNHRQTTRTVQSNYQNLFGGQQNVIIVEVQFDFIGSSELFRFVPAEVMISSGRYYQPLGNSVPMEVTITELDKVKAISEARNMMTPTFELIKANNQQATAWSESKESEIDAMLLQKKKQLLEFYS